MDVSPLTASQTPRVLPHLAHPVKNHFHHHRQQQPVSRTSGDGDEDSSVRCNSSNSNYRMGVEGGGDGGQDRTGVTTCQNGKMGGQSGSGGAVKGFHGNKTNDQTEVHAKTLSIPSSGPFLHQSQQRQLQPTPMEWLSRLKKEKREGGKEANMNVNALDADDVDYDIDDEDEDPVGCMTCGEDFPSMQAYVTHSCVASASSTRDARKNLASSNSTSRDDCVTGDADSRCHAENDAERFIGKIVYNPDGSAYVIEGTESDLEAELDQLHFPKLEGAIVDRDFTSSSIAASIPQIASALFVPRPYSAWSKVINNVCSSFRKAVPEGAPIVHCFKVFSVRGSSAPRTENGPCEDSVLSTLLPARSILMCFVCKLSFCLASSFVAHARHQHGLELLAEENSLLARPKVSAILQYVGKEKAPIISFLEPAPLRGITVSSTSTSLLPPYLLPTSVDGSPIASSAPTKVKYVYTSPRMVDDICTRLPNSAARNHDTDENCEEIDSKPSLPPPTYADSVSKSAAETSAAVYAFRDEAENGAEPAATVRPRSFKLDLFGGGRRDGSSRLPQNLPSPTAAAGGEPDEGSSFSNKPDQFAVTLSYSSPSSTQSPDLSPRDFYRPPSSSSAPSTPGPLFQGQLTPLFAGTCEEHPLGRAPGTECPRCDMILNSQQSLGGHMTMMHSRNSCKTLKCPKCNWHYKYQETLEIHMKEKHPDNDAQCLYCMTSQAHPRLARGETYSCGYKPYRCDVCNYSTTTKGNLSIHMQSDKHMNNMQELANGSSDMNVSGGPSPNSAQGQQNKAYANAVAAAAAAAAVVAAASQPGTVVSEEAMKKLKPKQSWRCEVCNYETLVARNLRIHMTSEKHTHNMMVLQQNVKHMQRDVMHLQLGQMMMMGQQSDSALFGLPPGALHPGMYPYDQSMLIPGAAPPPMFDLTLGIGARENGSNDELGGVVGMNGGADTTDAANIFQCTICELHCTDSLESLHQHMQLDRTKQREGENVSVEKTGPEKASVYMCHMCHYKTQLKANFQLHCKTDKHLQKLQLTNHIREGGPDNEWRLSYLSVSNPTQVRCNACGFHASSVHKLQLHATQLPHETNAHLFRLLQLSLARLQSSTPTPLSAFVYYYHCVLCDVNARTKQTMLRHAMGMHHLQLAQTKPLPIDPRDLYVAILQRDGEQVVFLEDADGERGHADHSPDGTEDHKLDIPGDNPSTPTPATITASSNSTSVSSHNHHYSNANNSSGQHVPLTIKSEGTPSTSSRNDDGQRSVTPSSRFSAPEVHYDYRLVVCPLCGDECEGYADYFEHVTRVHKVTSEGRQKLLSMVEVPAPELPPAASEQEDDDVADDLSRSHGMMLFTKDAATTSSGLEQITELDLDKMEEEHELMVKKFGVAESNGTVLPEKTEVDEYRCQVCTRTFPNIDQLCCHQNELGHLALKQTPRGPGYLCWKKGCNQYFKTTQTLQIHFREIHVKSNDVPDGDIVGSKDGEAKKFACGKCPLILRNEDSLQSHKLYHLVKEATQCSICHRCFTSVEQHMNHINSEDHMLSQEERDAYHKNLEINLTSLRSNSASDKFFCEYLGSKQERSSSDHSLPLGISSDKGCPLNLTGKITNSSSSSTQGKASKSKGVDALAADIARKVEERSRVQEQRSQDNEDDEEQLDRNKFVDQQSLEEFVHSQALNNYEDPSKKFKCHRCKVGFSKQNSLAEHNRSQQHKQGGSKASSVASSAPSSPSSSPSTAATNNAGVLERFHDPSRPYKCDVCIESFTQKNILTVHCNSVGHLHKLKEIGAAAYPASLMSDSSARTSPSHGAVVAALSTATATSLACLSNHSGGRTSGESFHDCMSVTSTPSMLSSSSTATYSASPMSKKPYRCNVCNSSYSQSISFDNHIRSVAHQNRVDKLQELIITGQQVFTQPIVEYPEMAQVDAAQMQQMQLFMELMQQQQLGAVVTCQSLQSFQMMQGLNSLSMFQGMAPLFTPAVTSSLFNPTTAALASYANAAMDQANQLHYSAQKVHSAEAKSEKADGRNLERMEVDNGVQSATATKYAISVKTEPEDDFTEMLASTKQDASTDATTAYTPSESRAEMSTCTTDLNMTSITKTVADILPSNPLLAASVPLMTARPRGYMGRFKPQVHRNLLENIGFECVMQFNEYTQHKKREREKDREVKKEVGAGDEDKENLDKGKDDEGLNGEIKEGENKERRPDMPEINKSRCLQCGREFSSVFVLKAHEEEVHKRVVPIGVVEDFGERFKEDLERKQPKPEPMPELVTVSTPTTHTHTQTTSVQATTSSTTTVFHTVTSATSTSSTSTSSSNVTEKVSSTKDSKEEMPPPPPPPPPHIPSPYDMAQMMPMLGMMPMSIPMNLMSLGMQNSLMSMSGLDLAGNFSLNMGLMDANMMSAQQQMQQAASAAAAAAAANQKRVRTRISDDQLKILRAHFDINNSPTEAQIQQMSDQSGLPQKVIKHWFRNTLFKERQRNKDSPYNFNNPPSTTFDLEEYEKTAKIPPSANTSTARAVATVKVEICEDGDEFQSVKQEAVTESIDMKPDVPCSQPMPTFPELQLPRYDTDDRREYESRSNTSTPLSSIPSTPTCSAPPTPTPTASAPGSLMDSHAFALAREALAVSANQNSILSKMSRANRTRFSDYQVKILQDYFDQNAYPKDDELDHLSKVLSLSPRVIVVWFQNARQKARKIYENQPGETTESNGSSPFGRTPNLNYLCKKCGAVFSKYYDLIKHQKRPCLSENNNNKPLLSTVTDEDSLSSGTSLDDSGLSDSLSIPSSFTKEIIHPPAAPTAATTAAASIVAEAASTAAISNAFRCDKCNASFNRIDLWQEHQKIHNLSTNLFPPFSSKSAFGMLQSLAQQEDSKAAITTASLPSSTSPTSSVGALSLSLGETSPSLGSKRKLDIMDDDRSSDDQPRDKRLRTTIMPEQLDYLYQKYQLDCNPSRKQLESIAAEVGLKKRVVQVWFQNTRARERKGQYRAHQQLIHKRCPFCRALFRAKTALETHLATKHPEEMAKGDINIDAIPDAAIEPPQPAHTMPGTSAAHQAAAAADFSKLLSPGNMSPYLSFMQPTNLALSFPPPLTSDSTIQLSMQHLYEDAYKKYITELSGNTHPPLTSPSPAPAPKPSHPSEAATSTPIRHSQSSASKSEKRSSVPPSRPPTSDDDTPLDLSVPAKSSGASETNAKEQSSHDVSKQQLSVDRSLNLGMNHSSSYSNSNGPHTTPSSALSFLEKSSREYDRQRHNSSYDDSYSETHSEFNDSEYQGDEGSSPSSPKSNSNLGGGSSGGSGQQHSSIQKRYRTQMTSLQVKVMKLLFIEYKTPTMAECELLGREIGLPKRVVQVWFQNARAKEKKFKLAMATKTHAGTPDVDFPKPPEECLLCNFKYSHKFTVQDHIFTRRHIDNAKAYVQGQADQDRDISDPASVSGLLRQQSREAAERKLWEKGASTAAAAAAAAAAASASSSSQQQQQLTQLQQGLSAAGFGLPTGLSSPFSLGSVQLVPEAGTSSSKKSASAKDGHSDRDKKNDAAGSSKDLHRQSHQQLQLDQQQSTAQHAAELAQMMALGYMPAIDPTYLSYMYPGLPGFFQGMTAMPMLQSGLLPGAEHMLAYDPLSFGTPLPLLQIPTQVIRHVSEKVLDATCTLAHYTQDCKSLGDLKGMVSAMDAACFTESSVDVGYICKTCQMVYPIRDACLTHQRMACYVAGGSGGKTMLKLEQLQYECRVCGDKFSTLAEVKAHCLLEAHKAKVTKFGASVLPSSALSSPAPAPRSSGKHSSSSSANASHAAASATASSPFRVNSGSPAAAHKNKDHYTPPTFVPVAPAFIPSSAPQRGSASVPPSTPSVPTASSSSSSSSSPYVSSPAPGSSVLEVDDSVKDNAAEMQLE